MPAFKTSQCASKLAPTEKAELSPGVCDTTWHRYGPPEETFTVGVDDGTVGVASKKRNVGVEEGTSVGVLVAVGEGVNVGRWIEVWVAAAPAV